MKRSVLKNGFNKTVLLTATGVCLLCLNLSAQLSLYGLNANFGVDADTRAGTTKYGKQTSPNITDDWFSLNQTGKGVLDTINASFYKSQLQANKNISFIQPMSKPLFSTVDNKLWLDAVYIRDYTSANGSDSTSFGTSAKNDMNPNVWNGKPTSIPNKTDIVDAFVHFRRDGVSVKDSLWLFTGVSTVGVNGDRYFDIELYKKRTFYNINSGKFTAQGLNDGRTEWLFDPFGNIIQTGDLIISVSYKSGQAPVIDVRIWVSKLTYQLVKPRLFNFDNNFDGTALFGYAGVVSKTNGTDFGSGGGNYGNAASIDTVYSTPWGTVNKSGAWSQNYEQLQFVEIGLNLTKMGIDAGLYNSLNACDRSFHSVVFKSRSSNSFSANLQDFVGPVDFVNPVLDYTVIGDTLTCANPIGVLTVNNPSSVGHFSWSSVDGNIISSNKDSTTIQVNKNGVYVLTGRLAAGCNVNRMEVVNVMTDNLPPVAIADITMTPSGALQLLGGDPVASNVLTPFGRSAGLEWQWTGPNGFASTQQNPFISTEWLYGAYYLRLKELRNGCVAYASLDMGFKAKLIDPTLSANSRNPLMEGVSDIETMNLQNTGANLRLITNQKESSNATVAFYSTSGQLLGKQSITLNKGYSNIELRLPSSNQLRVVTVYKGNKLLFTRKINH